MIWVGKFKIKVPEQLREKQTHFGVRKATDKSAKNHAHGKTP
jgi:hypothetical protein